MITTTLGALVEAQPALQRLAATKMPYAASHRLSKVIAAVNAEVKHFGEQRDALIKELGTERATTADERAQGAGATTVGIVPTSPHWPTFIARANELAAVPAEITVAPFDPSTVPSLEIAAADLLLLGPLVTTPPEEAPNGK